MSTPIVGHTGPGPMPGTDPREAARIVLGECPGLLFLPELPDRGLGADAIGRTAAMLTDLPVDISTRSWRLAGSEGRPARRAADLLDRDCDALEEADEIARGVTVDRDLSSGSAASSSSTPRVLQVRVTGPWSLAAALELPGGLPVLTDRGARRDVAESLAQGVAARAVRLAGRIGARPRILLDEPALWRVAGGAVAGPSRFDPIAAVPADRLGLALRRFADALRAGGVAEVILRVPAPGATVEPGAPAAWSVATDTARGETPLDGLCLPAAALGDHATLDAAGTVLGDGQVLQLEGLPGAERPPRSGAEVERAVATLLALLDRLSAPRYTTLDRLVLSPTVVQVTGGQGAAVDALAAVRRVAEAAPSLAE